MSDEKTMLGGAKWKIIRTDRSLPKGDVHAFERGADLHVSWGLFDAVLEALGRDEPDLPDPKWDESELVVLGNMLTATRSDDRKRLEGIISRLMTLYAKFVCDDPMPSSTDADARRVLAESGGK